MPTICSSADLRNRYNDISELCHTYPEPVFITKNRKTRPFSEAVSALRSRKNNELFHPHHHRWQQDIADALDYIELILKNKEAADEQLNEAEQKIYALSLFPKKHSLVNDPLPSSWRIRFIQIRNYLAFYVISEEQANVTIVRFLYQKTNWEVMLKYGISLI